MKTSKVKAILSTREFKGDRGSTWYFTVEMENGDKGQLGRKSETGLKVGDEIKYTVDDSGSYVKLKEERTGYQGRGGFSKQSTATVALTLAKDIAVANITASGKPLTMDAALAKKVTEFATELNTWLKANES